MARAKAFAGRRRNGGLRVRLPKALGVCDCFQLRVEPAIEQHEKSESRRFDCGAMSGPTVRGFSGRIVQPIPGVGKSLVQSFEVGVAGVFVAVKTEVRR